MEVIVMTVEKENIIAENRKKVSADLCSYVDESDCKLKIEVSITWLKKEDIDLKML